MWPRALPSRELFLEPSLEESLRDKVNRRHRLRQPAGDSTSSSREGAGRDRFPAASGSAASEVSRQISAAGIARTPAAAAAWWKRGMP